MVNPRYTIDELIPDGLLGKYQIAFAKQEEHLVQASKADYVPQDLGRDKYGQILNRFEAVDVELPLKPPLIDHIPRRFVRSDGVEKNLLGLHPKPGQKKCLVYGMGIAWDSRFEEFMAKNVGCEVHAFDCTISDQSAAVKDKDFTFHNWCIGSHDHVRMSSMTSYVKSKKQELNMKFKSLDQTMQELGHKDLDVLKFDIEGFEWQLFQTELLPGKVRPTQLAFELHTEGANTAAVPADVVRGKNNRAVNQMFLGMHKLGYRVVSKELNEGDPHCAEFVLVKAE